MSKIICTGGSGFVGTHTIKVLEETGHEVMNFDLKEGYDIRDRRQLIEAIDPGDKILHLAAIARFADADEDPLLAYETNVKGTENIAYAAGLRRAERVVYSSTGSVYMPIDEDPPITEEFKARGNSVYACSKYLGELYLKKYKIPYVTLRYGHLYGEGKIGHGAIGGFIDRMSRGLKPVLYGGKQSNSFTYIKDIVKANMLALDTKNINEAYNIGSPDELTTEGVFETLSKLFGYQKEFEYLPARSVDPLRFVYDMSKAKDKLGFEADYSFEDGMKDWFELSGGKESLIKSIKNG